MSRVASRRAPRSRASDGRSNCATEHVVDIDVRRAGPRAAATGSRPSRARGERGAQSGRNRTGPGALVGRKSRVARRQREAIRIAYRRHHVHTHPEVQVAHDLLDHRHLLRVLLAEVHDIGTGRC